MSTVRLLKDYQFGDRPAGKKGSLYSVPFLVARDLVANGTAAHPLGAKAEQMTPAAGDDLRAALASRDREIEALRKRLAETENVSPSADPATGDKAKK